MGSGEIDFASVNKAFSNQSAGFDSEDQSNPILQDLRKQVYAHIEKYLKPHSEILELNSGTGIDAVYFAKQGHHVYATDLSDGMIRQIENKISRYSLQSNIQVKQLSYLKLEEITDKKFDFAFSNFGGLNCVPDLSKVTSPLSKLLRPGAFVTFVIMPPVCFWEVATLVKGNRHALRRFNKSGILAHLEGEYFRTWYHSVSSIISAFGKNFKLIECEGLACISPPPYAKDFAIRHSRLYNLLKSSDKLIRHWFPFNRWADHVIVTFQYSS